MSTVDTNNPLNEIALDALEHKLSSRDIRMSNLSIPHYCADKDNKRSNFWEWFYSVMKFTKEVKEVKYLWDKNYVFGFISKETCEVLLSKEPEGIVRIFYTIKRRTIFAYLLIDLDVNLVPLSAAANQRRAFIVSGTR